jgi:hypothetical protein
MVPTRSWNMIPFGAPENLLLCIPFDGRNPTYGVSTPPRLSVPGSSTKRSASASAEHANQTIYSHKPALCRALVCA